MELDEERASDSKKLDAVIQETTRTEEYARLVEILSPMAEVIRRSSAKVPSVENDRRKLKDRFAKSAKLMLSFREDSKAQGSTEIFTLRKALVYLGLFETTMPNLTDAIVLLFIENGHDFFVDIKNKYAEHLDDLDRASMYDKLRFFNRHDLGFLTDYISEFNTLRNKVAHMDFSVETGGKISVEKRSYDLEKEIDNLGRFVLMVSKALRDSEAFTL